MSKPWILVCPSSRGIGHALTRHLLQHTRAPVFATARAPGDQQSALRDALLRGLAPSASGRLHLARVDVTDEATIRSAAEQAAELFPPRQNHLRLALAVPGVLRPEKAPAQVDAEAALMTYRVDVDVSQRKGKVITIYDVKMVLHNPNNWHWVNKDVSEWAKQWFQDNLTKIQVENGDVKAGVSKVVSMEGDVDVSQRKGKVITIYDVKLVLEYSGSAPDADEVSGTITVPEVAHDTEEDEFVFDIDIYSESKEKQPVKDLVRTKLVPELRKTFLQLPGALIAEHGKDIQHAPGSNPSSGFSTPKMHPQTAAAAKPAQQAVAQQSGGKLVNTTTVTESEEFRTTAAELYQTFTDPQRLAAFTRAPPKVFEGAKVGGRFELFGGNVAGEYLELEEPTKIVQSWRLDQWPAGHYSRLQIEFDQNDVDSVTVMRVTWSGVPVGQEEVTKRNWDEYYVRSIKKTFGFGTIL